ncbi:uncharacterized protein LOC127101788 [Lathyrus oleraceus]|uniref:uncharacterized protein LOC127101788 n=1 Tax=Pisum sativum TaxID=3888 RepID=UPI0021CF6D8F|nr:uncharacterized protein LOC127101788 [Pisum sativum]
MACVVSGRSKCDALVYACFNLLKMVAGRNDDALAEALTLLAGAILQMNAGDREHDADEFRALAQEWLKAIEKIFRVMNCSNAQKVQFDTYMLEKEAEDWWHNTIQRFNEDGIEVTWTLFHYAFLEKYFPEDSRIYDKDSRESDAHYKSLHDKKGKWQFRRKTYYGKKKVGDGKKPSGGGSHTPVKCFRYGVEGHRAPECPKGDVTCFKCGKQGHKYFDCRVGSNMTCYNCGEQGHISTKRNKPKKEQAKGKCLHCPVLILLLRRD